MHGIYYNATIAAYVTLYLRLGKDEVGSSNLPSSSTKNLETTMVSRFFLFCVCCEQMTETATKTATGHKKNAGNPPGVAL